MIHIAVLIVFAVFIDGLPFRNQNSILPSNVQAPYFQDQQGLFSNEYSQYQGQNSQYQQPAVPYQPRQFRGGPYQYQQGTYPNQYQPVSPSNQQYVPYQFQEGTFPSQYRDVQYAQYPQVPRGVDAGHISQPAQQLVSPYQVPADVNAVSPGQVTQPAPSDGPCQDCTCDTTTGVCTPNNPNSGEKPSAPTVSKYQYIQVMSMENKVYTIPAKNKVEACTKYTPEFKCGKCDDDKYLDTTNNKCEKLTKMPLCLTPEPNGTPNAETGLISCAECESPNVPVIDTKNANYQFCIRPPSAGTASGFNPIFILDQGQYLCLTQKEISEPGTGSKYHGLVPNDCSNVEFDDWNMFQTDYEPQKYQGIRTKATDNSGKIHLATFQTQGGQVLDNKLTIVRIATDHWDQDVDRYFVYNGTNFLLQPPDGKTKYNVDRCMGLTPQVDNPNEKMLAINAGNCANMGYLIYVQNPKDPNASPF